MGVYRALRPVLVFSRSVAIYPQSKDSKNRIIFYAYFFLYSTTIFVSSIGAFLWLQFNQLAWFGTAMHSIIERGRILAVFVNYSAAAATVLLEYKTFQGVLRGLHDAAHALSNIGLKVRYDNTCVTRILLVRAVSQTLLFAMEIYTSKDSEHNYVVFNTLSSHLPLFSLCALQLQAHSLLKFVSQHLSLMSSKLNEAQNFPLEKLISLLRTYDTLERTALTINDCFSLNTILSISCIFYYVIVAFYFIASSGMIHSLISYDVYAYCIAIIFLKIFETWTIIEPFVDLTDKIEKFNDSLIRLIVKERSGKIASNEKVQVHLSNKNSITFTASGFFPLDYSLVHSMIGALATFLVILIQFDISSSQLK